MIEVKARILGRSVFIPEENINCELTFTYHGEKPKKGKQLQEGVGSEDIRPAHDVASIAWASAQIYCQCDINERRLLLPTSEFNNKHEHKQRTSFSPVTGEKGHCLYSTEAHVVFCDLKLKKGETKKFIYSEKVPLDVPPSYKGHNIKFSYKLCVGIGRIGKQLCLLRLPFRLFELKGILKSLHNKSTSNDDHLSQPEHTSSPVSSTEYLTQDNPFLKDNLENCYSTLDAAMDALTTFTVKRNLNTYNIQSSSGAVGKFCLSKHYYRLGEDILGTFDFSDSKVRCIKYVVSLQVEESISSKSLLQPSNSDLIHYMTMSRYEECCYSATKTNFILPVPVTSTPEFTHKIVTVKWRLHFEFTIQSSDTNITNDNKEESTDLNDCIPKQLKCESMLWNLPVHVVATNPILASLMMQAESSETICLSVP